MTTNLKKRSGLAAAGLSLLMPGLGFLYAGKWKIAAISFLCLFLLAVIPAWSRTILIYEIYLEIFLLTVIFYISIVAASFMVARLNSPAQLEEYQKWYVYVSIFGVWLFVNSLIIEYRPLLFGFENFRIPSGSMKETLDVNDFILIDTWAYKDKEPERGDIAIFRFPLNERVLYVKRVIAKGGDSVLINQGKVIINGNPINEEYVKNDTLNAYASRDFKLLVPKGHYFMLGDNRNNSYDSRAWGFVSHQQLRGKAKFIWFSFDKSGLRMERFGRKF